MLILALNCWMCAFVFISSHSFILVLVREREKKQHQTMLQTNMNPIKSSRTMGNDHDTEKMVCHLFLDESFRPDRIKDT